MSNSQEEESQKKKQANAELQSKLKKVQQISPSLVKYDTPYLVSTTSKKKKEQNEEELNETRMNKLLCYAFDLEGKKKSETETYSVKDALNIILPPIKERKEDQLQVRYVSCNPVTKTEVTDLKSGLTKNLSVLQAKETGIDMTRETLYSQCFDELIRQVTINCLQRGILMKLVKNEYENQMKTYQNLYQSCIAYGVRKWIVAEKEKESVNKECEEIEEENKKLQEEIDALEKDISETRKVDEKERKMAWDTHRAILEDKVKSIKIIKDTMKKRFLDLKSFRVEKIKNIDY